MSSIRVACHVHSEWSYDASWGLDKLAAAFSRRGYDAILMAEHDRGFDQARWEEYRSACARASTAEILVVPGIEYSDAANAVHVPVWGDLPFLGEGLDTGELLSQVEQHGGIAVLAHPGRRKVLDTIDPGLLERFTGIELWNRKYDGYAPNRAVETVLRDHPRLLATAGLDFHTARQFHPLAMVLTVSGPVSQGGVFEALAQRQARATAFRVDARRFAQDPCYPAMRGLERTRQRLAQRLRQIRTGR